MQAKQNLVIQHNYYMSEIMRPVETPVPSTLKNCEISQNNVINKKKMTKQLFSFYLRTILSLDS